MKVLFALLSAVFLSSCVHTAIAPVATPQGVPVVIRIPGARVGVKAKPEQIAAIDSKVEQAIVGKSGQAETAKDPAIIAAGPVGFFGDVTTRKGEKFVGYSPAIVIRSTYPPDAVDRVAGQVAAAYYRAAKKHFDVRPITDFANKPSKPKP